MIRVRPNTRPVNVRLVAVVARLEGLVDLVAVAHVVPGEGGHVLVVEGLLDEEVVELVHLLLCLVHSEEIYFEPLQKYC